MVKVHKNRFANHNKFWGGGEELSQLSLSESGVHHDQSVVEQHTEKHHPHASITKNQTGPENVTCVTFTLLLMIYFQPLCFYVSIKVNE